MLCYKKHRKRYSEQKRETNNIDLTLITFGNKILPIIHVIGVDHYSVIYGICIIRIHDTVSHTPNQ